MGADLYESYCGSILASAALGAASYQILSLEQQTKAILAPMLIAAVGIFLSIIGIFLVKTKENAGVKSLLRSLAFGTNISAVLIAGASFLVLYLLGIENWLGLSLSVVRFVGRNYHRPICRILHLSVVPAYQTHC
jgi:K(+)-stimulated pyrophosphate-energized sodium pump